MSVVDAKPFHPRPDDMRHECEDKFANAARWRDLGSAEVSTSAFGTNTSFDRKAVLSMGEAWAYKFRGYDEDGAK